MKTNLDNLYKTDKGYETEGIWLEISEGVGFKVKRFGGFNASSVKQSLAKYYKPYSKQIEAGTLPESKEAEISTKVFVDSCVLDWKGIEIDGEVKEFSKDLCIKFLLELPELSKVLVDYATDKNNFKESLGNF